MLVSGFNNQIGSTPKSSKVARTLVRSFAVLMVLFMFSEAKHAAQQNVEERPFSYLSAEGLGLYFIPEGCHPTDTRVLNWKLLLSHTQRERNPHLASFILLDKQCDIKIDGIIVDFAKRKRLIAVDRDPKPTWHENSMYKRLGLQNIRFALTNCREPYFRRGHDICIALRPKASCPYISFFDAKKYHATFKGTGYFSGYGHHRFLLRVFHNPSKGVIVAVTTRHVTNDKQINLNTNLTRTKLDVDELEAEKFDYCDLMNSSYAFTPGGRSPASYRLIESLHSGAIPILFFERGDERVVLPYENIINWEDCAKIHIFISQVEHTLLADDKTQIMKEKCTVILKQFFWDDDTLVNTFLASIQNRINDTAAKEIIS